MGFLFSLTIIMVAIIGTVNMTTTINATDEEMTGTNKDIVLGSIDEGI